MFRTFAQNLADRGDTPRRLTRRTDRKLVHQPPRICGRPAGPADDPLRAFRLRSRRIVNGQAMDCAAGERGARSAGAARPCGQGCGVQGPPRPDPAGDGPVGIRTGVEGHAGGGGAGNLGPLDRVAASTVRRGRPGVVPGPEEAGPPERRADLRQRDGGEADRRGLQPGPRGARPVDASVAGGSDGRVEHRPILRAGDCP